MTLLAHLDVMGFCPSPNLTVHENRKKEPGLYQQKIRETEEVGVLQKYLAPKKDWNLTVRIDYYLQGSRFTHSDLDNLSKTVLDGVFKKKGERNNTRDRWVTTLEAKKIEVSKLNEERTEIWVFMHKKL
jgi:hypothetical protein